MRHIDDYTNHDPAQGIYISSGVIGGVGMLAILTGIPTLAVGRYKDSYYLVYEKQPNTCLAASFIVLG